MSLSLRLFSVEVIDDAAGLQRMMLLPSMNCFLVNI